MMVHFVGVCVRCISSCPGLGKCISTFGNYSHQPTCINLAAICCNHAIAIIVKLCTWLLHSLFFMTMGRVTVFRTYTAQGNSKYIEHKLQQMGHHNKHRLYHPNGALRSSILPTITLLHPCTTRKGLPFTYNGASVVQKTG